MRSMSFRLAILVALSALLPCIAYCGYEVAMRNDPYFAFKLHPRALFCGQLLLTLSVLLISKQAKLSLGWPISTAIIAFLCFSFLTPVDVRPEAYVRQQLKLQPYLEVSRWTINFAVFSAIQLSGFVFAALRQFLSKNSVNGSFTKEP
jgi:hypothetical protein